MSELSIKALQADLDVASKYGGPMRQAQTKDPVLELLEVAKRLRPGKTDAALWYQLQAAIAKVDRLYGVDKS